MLSISAASPGSTTPPPPRPGTYPAPALAPTARTTRDGFGRPVLVERTRREPSGAYSFEEIGRAGFSDLWSYAWSLTPVDDSHTLVNMSQRDGLGRPFYSYRSSSERYQYFDSHGDPRVVLGTDPDETSSPYSLVTTTQYADARHRPTRVVRPDLLQTAVRYLDRHDSRTGLGGGFDAPSGTAVQVVDAAGAVASTEVYDGLGHTVVSDRGGLATTLVHDAAGAVTQVIEPDGTVTVIHHDQRGLTTSVERFGSVGLSSSAHPLHTQTYEYDADGAVWGATSDGASTQYVRDDWGRVREIVRPPSSLPGYGNTHLYYQYDWRLDGVGRVSNRAGDRLLVR